MEDVPLLYIATHLHCYSFRTDAARSLKREIERWTITPEKPSGELFSRFCAMFPNNPFLEQKGLLPGAEITGRAAEGYFLEKGNPLTLRPLGTQQGDGKALYLEDDILDIFLNRKKQEVKNACLSILQRCDQALEKKEKEFSHILNQRFWDKGRFWASPTLLDALFCLIFMGFSAWYVGVASGIPYILTHMQTIVPELMSVGGMVAAQFVLTLLVAIVSLFLFPGSVNIIVKAVYRSRIIGLFQKAKKERRKLGKQLENLSPEKWFQAFQAALREDRAYLSDHLTAGVWPLKSSGMLREISAPINTAIDTELPESPWKGYRTPGEKRRWLLRLVVIAYIIFTALQVYGLAIF